MFCTGACLTFTDVAGLKTAYRRLLLVLAVTTVTLPAFAWLASHLVSGPALRGGVLAAGVAPTEVASVALTGLAGGEAALAAALLAGSTVVTVLLAGPILALLGAQSTTSQLGLLATLALVVALPLAAGFAMRSVDPLGGRDVPLLRIMAMLSLLVLLWEVASELHLRVSDASMLAALLVYLACGAALGRLSGLAPRPTGAPPSSCPRRCAISPSPRGSPPAPSARRRSTLASTASWCWSSARPPSTLSGGGSRLPHSLEDQEDLNLVPGQGARQRRQCGDAPAGRLAGQTDAAVDGRTPGAGPRNVLLEPLYRRT